MEMSFLNTECLDMHVQFCMPVELQSQVEELLFKDVIDTFINNKQEKAKPADFYITPVLDDEKKGHTDTQIMLPLMIVQSNEEPEVTLTGTQKEHSYFKQESFASVSNSNVHSFFEAKAVSVQVTNDETAINNMEKTTKAVSVKVTNDETAINNMEKTTKAVEYFDDYLKDNTIKAADKTELITESKTGSKLLGNENKSTDAFEVKVKEQQNSDIRENVVIQPRLQSEKIQPTGTVTQPDEVFKPVISQISETITKMEITEGKITVKLEPEHLGSITINVEDDGDGLTAYVLTQKDETRKIISESLDELRVILSDKMIRLEKIVVQTQENKQFDTGSFLSQQNSRHAFNDTKGRHIPVYQNGSEEKIKENPAEKKQGYLQYSNGINIFI